MYSWGPECKLVLGAYGGVTFDRRRDLFVHACEPWTPDTLPYSCTALRSLDTHRLHEAKHSGASRKPSIRKQVIFYQEQFADSYIPDDFLRQMLREDTQAVPEARHSCLYAHLNDGMVVLVHPTGPNLSTLSFTPLYCKEGDEGAEGGGAEGGEDAEGGGEKESTPACESQPPPQRQPEPTLIVDWWARRKEQHKGRIKKVCADARGQALAALSSTFKIRLYAARACRTMQEIEFDEDVHDCCLSQFGRSLLVGAKSGCKLFDTETAKDSNAWKIDTAGGVRHCSVLSEQTYIAASINKLIVCDPRSAAHRSLPFNIGGNPFGLTTGTVLNTLVFLSGQESLHAIDLRKPKHPVLQWMNAEFFGGAPLSMLQAVDARNDLGIDLLTGVAREELLSVPIVSQPSLNTITSLTPSMQSSLNCNRLFMRLKNRQDIIGHSWTFNPEAGSHVSFHMLHDSRHIAYQHHSFSSLYAGNAAESHDTLETENYECRPVYEDYHPRKNHTDLYKMCMRRDLIKVYADLSEARQRELSSWQVPIKPGGRVPSRLNRHTSSSKNLGRVQMVDDYFLTSAARILHKQWSI